MKRLGEYDGFGNLIEETVWMNDVPVAVLQPSGSSVAIYYIHTDHLNTPRQITRPSDNAQMWTWFSDPFGSDAANGNPSGAGTFSYDGRFPGQIFDGQAGLHYNYLRDYDPATGGYIESDPIGLHGGINTYQYADADPANVFDPTGLYPFTIWQVFSWKREDCNESDWSFCRAKCAPGRALGCYVTLKWKIKSAKGGNLIRLRERNVECNCEEFECSLPSPRSRLDTILSPPPVILPWWTLIPVF